VWGIFLGALVAAIAMGLRGCVIATTLIQTIASTRFTMITIAALMGLGFITRFCGLDATLGLAFARTGLF
jgi:lactate permease